jgi:hypothetical protein
MLGPCARQPPRWPGGSRPGKVESSGSTGASSTSHPTPLDEQLGNNTGLEPAVRGVIGGGTDTDDRASTWLAL